MALASNHAELVAAVNAAAPGDIIELTPGIWPDASLNQWNLTNLNPQVTLRSQDPANPAVIQNMICYPIAGMTLEDLTIEFKDAGQDYYHVPCVFVNSSDITFRRVHFKGLVKADGWGWGMGLNVRDSNNVLIEDCVFNDWFTAAGLSGNTNMQVLRNVVNRSRSEGFQGANNDDCLIHENEMYDFAGNTADGAHPDPIQFFTAGTTSPSVNLTITDNVILMGGNRYTQGIFLGDETGIGYVNVVIRGNVINTSHVNGIVVGACNGLVIEDNTVQFNQALIEALGLNPADPVYIPTVVLHPQAGPNAVVRNNVLPIGPILQGAGVDDNNVIIPWSQSPNFFSDPHKHPSARIGDFQVIDPAMTAGSALTRAGAPPPPPPPPPGNEAPVAVNDSFTIDQDSALHVLRTDLLVNDTDADGDALTVTAVQNPVNGTVTMDAMFAIFTPTAGYHGPASFEYVVSDGTDTDVGVVTVTVNEVVAPPPPPPDPDPCAVPVGHATKMSDGSYVDV